MSIGFDRPLVAEVRQEEQERRFEARIEDPMRQWKLSPMDLESYARWYDYSQARDMMPEATDTKAAPWYIVRSDDKRRALKLHIAPPQPGSLQGGASRKNQTPEAIAQEGVRRSSHDESSEFRRGEILRMWLFA